MQALNVLPFNNHAAIALVMKTKKKIPKKEVRRRPPVYLT